MSNSNDIEVTEYLEEKESEDFSPSELCSLISDEFGILKDLKNKVDRASKNAEKAQNKAENAGKKTAKRGFFKDHKKEAIEELQTAGSTMATAIETNAQAQNKSFELQEELAKISKKLFMLGLGNTVNNRIVVRELELKLKGATQEEISELARKELLIVIKQLKEQQDLKKKHENIKTKLRQHHKKLDNTITRQDEHEKKLLAQAEADKRHDVKLKKLAETDRHHEAEFDKRAKIDRNHTAKLEERAEIDKRHDEQFENIQMQLDSLHSINVIAKIALGLSILSLIVMSIYFFS